MARWGAFRPTSYTVAVLVFRGKRSARGMKCVVEEILPRLSHLREDRPLRVQEDFSLLSLTPLSYERPGIGSPIPGDVLVA